MKKVIFVMGMSGTGKSTFIKKRFQDEIVLDLLDFQKELWDDHENPTTELVLQSYENIKLEILKQIENHDTIVVEHTLLKTIRREPYIEALKDKGIYIVGHYLDITEKCYIERNGKYLASYLYRNCKMIQELPTIQEGFNEVYIVEQKLEEE